MAKKRTSLDAISLQEDLTEPTTDPPPSATSSPKKKKIIKQTAYLPEPVYEQLRTLAFEERAKMHNYLMEGLSLVFQKRGLPSIHELLQKK